MKINIASIRFRLLASFTAMTFITVFLVAFTFVGLGYLSKSTKELFEVKQPSQMWVLGLSSAVQKTNVSVQSYMLYEEMAYKETWVQNWDKDIKEALDSLNNQVKLWNDPESQVIYAKILNRLEVLKTGQQAVLDAQAEVVEEEVIEEEAEPVDEFDLMAGMDENGEELESIEEEEIMDVNIEPSNKDLFKTTVYPISEEIDQLNRQLFEAILASSKGISANTNQYLFRFRIIELLMIISALGAAWFLYYFLSKRIQKTISNIKGQINILSKGNIPNAIKVEEDELSVVHQEIEVLASNLNNLKSFAMEVGQGKFDNDITVFNNSGEIGTSLAGMRDSLKKVAEEDTIRNWTNKGVAEFGDILRKYSDNLDELADKLLTGLVKYLKGNQGSLFVLNNEEEGEYFLELKAAYAFDRKKFVQKRVEIGQGLVGQCYLEKQTIHLRKVPNEYITITSGLGLANPTYLMIVPLKFNENVFGIVEIASFIDFKPYEIDLVEKLGESVASSLSTVKINQNTRKLLQESQMMTEQMRAQEEEMRQNMEELQATQEEMQRNTREQEEKQEELRDNYEKLRASREESTDLVKKTEGQLKKLDSSIVRINFTNQGNILDVNIGFSEIIGKSLGQMEDKPFANYLQIQPEEAWSKAAKGDKIKVQLVIKADSQILSGHLMKENEDFNAAIMFIGYLAENVVSPSTTTPTKDDGYLKERLKENADLLRKLKEE